MDYLRCVDSVSTSNNVSNKYDSTLDQMVNIEKNLKDTSVFVEFMI